VSKLGEAKLIPVQRRWLEPGYPRQYPLPALAYRSEAIHCIPLVTFPIFLLPVQETEIWQGTEKCLGMSKSTIGFEEPSLVVIQ
jgi:hypothetical protein